MKAALLVLACATLAPASFGQAKPLAGSAGVIGTPARVGAYQFTLTSANFATRVIRDHDTAVAEKGKKFLVINYTVQNPGKTDLPFDWGSIRFTVVSADNANHENVEEVVNPEKLTRLNLEIKPVQKIPAMTYVEVPANDPIPKLMVVSGSAPVLRFDLKGKVKKFTGMFAAADGVTAIDTGAAKIGEKVELGHMDFVVEKVEDSAAAIGETEPGENEKLVVVTVAYTNSSKTDRGLDYGTYAVSMKDTNGEAMEYKSLIRAVGTGTVNQELKAGETLRGRLLFTAPKAATAASLLFAFGEGRAVKVALK